MTKPNYRIAEIALRVKDLENSVAFYQSELGLTVHKRLPHVVFLEVGPLESPLGAGGHPLLLALFKRDDPVDRSRSTLDHVAFEIPADAYDTERERFAARGLVISERVWPDTLPWPGRAFFFRDPDGNVLEFIAGAADGG